MSSVGAARGFASRASWNCCRHHCPLQENKRPAAGQRQPQQVPTSLCDVRLDWNTAMTNDKASPRTDLKRGAWQGRQETAATGHRANARTRKQLPKTRDSDCAIKSLGARSAMPCAAGKLTLDLRLCLTRQKAVNLLDKLCILLAQKHTVQISELLQQLGGTSASNAELKPLEHGTGTSIACLVEAHA